MQEGNVDVAPLVTAPRRSKETLTEGKQTRNLLILATFTLTRIKFLIIPSFYRPPLSPPPGPLLSPPPPLSLSPQRKRARVTQNYTDHPHPLAQPGGLLLNLEVKEMKGKHPECGTTASGMSASMIKFVVE